MIAPSDGSARSLMVVPFTFGGCRSRPLGVRLMMCQWDGLCVYGGRANLDNFTRA
jgi:hypothetical protein